MLHFSSWYIINSWDSMAISGIDSTMTSMDMWMRLHFTAYIQKSDRSVIRSFVRLLIRTRAHSTPLTRWWMNKWKWMDGEEGARACCRQFVFILSYHIIVITIVVSTITKWIWAHLLGVSEIFYMFDFCSMLVSIHSLIHNDDTQAETKVRQIERDNNSISKINSKHNSGLGTRFFNACHHTKKKKRNTRNLYVRSKFSYSIQMCYTKRKMVDVSVKTDYHHQTEFDFHLIYICSKYYENIIIHRHTNCAYKRIFFP